MRAAVLVCALVALPAAAAPAPRPVMSQFVVTNTTKQPIRCMVMKGGPITKLITLQPGASRTETLPGAQLISLACPKVRSTVFGPLAPGRYVFHAVKGRADLARQTP